MSSAKFDLGTIEQHNTREDLWIIIDNKVYDVTEFLNEHPGGSEMFLNHGGQDASEAFERVGHRENEKVMSLIAKYYIGDVILSASESSSVSSGDADDEEERPKSYLSSESHHDLTDSMKKEEALKKEAAMKKQMQ